MVSGSGYYPAIEPNLEVYGTVQRTIVFIPFGISGMAQSRLSEWYVLGTVEQKDTTDQVISDNASESQPTSGVSWWMDLGLSGASQPTSQESKQEKSFYIYVRISKTIKFFSSTDRLNSVKEIFKEIDDSM